MAGKKKTVNKETPEEKRERDYQNMIKERLPYCPEPTYFFNIGDRVEIGRLEDVYVIGVYENSKIYEIDYSSTNNNYGNPIKTEHQKMFVQWVDIRPYREIQPETTLIKNNDLRMNFMQMHIGSLLNKTYHFGVDFNPDYQRGYVWESEDKVALIDSIFNNIDIGKFAFIHLGYSGDNSYEILDGKQRMRAILDYFENRFDYKGKYFNDLSAREQDFFEDYSISVAETQNADRKQVLKYFLTLNKHGKIMDKRQLEKVEKMLEEIQ